MAENSLTQPQQPDSPQESSGVRLSKAEWDEISNCSSALFAALRCFEQHNDEAWEIVIAVQQRFQRAVAPVEERLTDEYYAQSE